MEEIRIDCLNQTEQELAAAKELRQDIFRLNHTMPDTDEYQDLLHKVFPHLGENCRVEIPFSGVRTANVKFGRNVIVMPGCLMMSAGGITIDDEVMIAANVQLISNNHDVEQRNVITWKPVYKVLKCPELKVWIVNARHIKYVPGHKTDKADSAWICKLLLAGLLKPRMKLVSTVKRSRLLP